MFSSISKILSNRNYVNHSAERMLNLSSSGNIEQTD